MDRGGDFEQVGAHQDDVSRGHGHIRARPDGDAHIGLGQGWGVVDTIANHGHDMTFGLELFHFVGLVSRQDFRQDTVDPDLGCNGLGCLAVIARDHGDLDAHFVQLRDRLGAGRLDRVSDGDDAGKLAIDGDEHRCLACARETVGVRMTSVISREGNLFPCHQARIAEQHRTPGDDNRDAMTGDGLEVRCFGKSQGTLCGTANNRFTKRMLRPFFGSSSESKQIICR